MLACLFWRANENPARTAIRSDLEWGIQTGLYLSGWANGAAAHSYLGGDRGSRRGGADGIRHRDIKVVRDLIGIPRYGEGLLNGIKSR
jgi:hypothetical protein